MNASNSRVILSSAGTPEPSVSLVSIFRGQDQYAVLYGTG